jgi:hypothetical protein
MGPKGTVLESSIPLSIKDHKPLQSNRQHPTNHIVSAHNITQCQSKLASNFFKRTFQCDGVTFDRNTLENFLNLKRKFEEDDVHQDNVTIISLDIKDMHPQCRFKALQDAVQHCMLWLPALDHEKIHCCLDILKFGMGNIIITFLDKYYEYGVEPDPDCHGLTIESFKQAILVNLEATYIIEKLLRLLERQVWFIGAYNKDKMIAFCGYR